MRRRRQNAPSTSSFYGRGGRTEAERQQDRLERSPVHVAINREIMAAADAAGVLALAEGRRGELDGVNLSTALQRVAKLGGARWGPLSA